MKFSLRLSFLALCLAAAPFARAQYLNGQNAGTYPLWGQLLFTTSAHPSPPTNGSLSTPSDFAIDPTTGKFFVSDSANNRVLRFPSSAAYVQGAAAELEFGWPDDPAAFTTSTPVTSPPTKKSLSGPTGILVDSSGTLWVADSGNNRVLGYEEAGSKTNSGPDATYVFGQISFISGSASVPPTQASMNNPTGLVMDSSGKLYVIDKGNNRILRFSSPYTPSNSITAIPADGLFGHINFFDASAGVINTDDPSNTYTMLNAPTTAEIDSSGNLWVADTLNNRVVSFPVSLVTPQGGGSATRVVGQPDFFNNLPNTTQDGLSGPAGVTFDVLGRLYVADGGNNRVLIYENSSGLATTGANANLVLGQSDFISGLPNTSQSGLKSPAGIVFSNLNLWVTDKGNNRVLNYLITGGTPYISAPPKVKLPTTKNKTFSYTVLNNSSASDVFVLKVSVPSTTNQLAKLTFKYNGTDITSALKAGTFTTPELFAGQGVGISVKVQPKTKAKKSGGTVTFTAVATSFTVSSNSTQQTIKAKFNKPKSTTN